jgi:hypothetical protein
VKKQSIKQCLAAYEFVCAVVIFKWYKKEKFTRTRITHSDENPFQGLKGHSVKDLKPTS